MSADQCRARCRSCKHSSTESQEPALLSSLWSFLPPALSSGLCAVCTQLHSLTKVTTAAVPIDWSNG